MTGGNITLFALHTLLAVARSGSFAVAARQKGVTPSAVSRQIAVLEDELGFRLFDRTTRRLVLTEAGQLYVERAERLAFQLEEARTVARDALVGAQGLLRIGASVAFGERWLIPRLVDFQATYPKIDLELALNDSPVDIAKENIDVAIRLGSKVVGDYVVSKLFDTRYVVVAAPAYLKREGPIVSPTDLVSRRCLTFSMAKYRARWRLRHQSGDMVEVPLQPLLAISSAVGLRRAALLGLGPAVLATWTITDDLCRGDLVQLFPGWEATAEDFDTAAWLLYATRSYVPAKTRAFIDYLKS